jgi:hypothetical protein
MSELLLEVGNFKVMGNQQSPNSLSIDVKGLGSVLVSKEDGRLTASLTALESAKSNDAELDLGRILERGFLTDLELMKFNAINWELWQKNDSYTDLELSVFKDGPEPSDEHSFNVHLTFSWEEKLIYLTLGGNLGDGFNSYMSVSNDNSRLTAQVAARIDACREDGTEGKYIEYIDSDLAAWNDVMDGIAELSLLLGLGK